MKARSIASLLVLSSLLIITILAAVTPLVDLLTSTLVFDASGQPTGDPIEGDHPIPTGDPIEGDHPIPTQSTSSPPP